MRGRPDNAEREAVAIAGRPWDRQPNESPEAFLGFSRWSQHPTRSRDFLGHPPAVLE
jgi:hypothetical protein